MRLISRSAKKLGPTRRLAALCVLLAGGCVDAFGGAAIEVSLDPSVEGPAPAGVSPAGGRPPAGTHYSFYAINESELSCDAGVCPAGSTCDERANACIDDATMRPVVTDSYAFKVADFQVQPIINPDSPCFIENSLRPFPGLPTAREADRLRFDTGISDPINAPEGTDEGILTDIITADRRMELLPRIRANVNAVTSFSNALPPGVDPAYLVETLDEDSNGFPDCVEDNPNVDPNKIPAPNCILDQSNARRLQLCQQFWKEHPDFYEGSDLVFTLPLNGKWHGAVTTTDPRNGVGLVGGASFLVEPTLNDFDLFVMNWQYSDFDGDGNPDYPADTAAREKSRVGFHYMEGRPFVKTRGVINVKLANRVFQITGEAAIFPSLGEDSIHF